MYKISEPILIVINMLLPLIIALPLCLSSFVIMAIVKAYKNNENEVKTIVSIKEVALLVLLNYIPAILVVISFNISFILVLLLGLLYSLIITFVTLFNAKVIIKNSILILVNLHLLVLNSIAVWFSVLAQVSSDAEANMIMFLVLYILLLVNVITVVVSTVFGIKNRKKVIGFINKTFNFQKEVKEFFETENNEIEKNKKSCAEKKKTEREKINNNEGTLEERMIYAYIGKNVDKILTSRINIPAALLGTIWYFYRKLYKLAFNSFLPCFISICLLSIIFWLPLEGPGVAGLFEVFVIFLWFILTVIALIISVIINLFNANKFYRTHAEKVINIILETSKDMEEEKLLKLAYEKGNINVFKSAKSKITEINFKKVIASIIVVILIIVVIFAITSKDSMPKDMGAGPSVTSKEPNNPFDPIKVLP